MIHRHSTYAPDTAVDQLGPAALDDLLERGDLETWAPLAHEVALRPWGAIADTILRLCDAHPMYGTAPLWRAHIAAHERDIVKSCGLAGGGRVTASGRRARCEWRSPRVARARGDATQAMVIAGYAIRRC
jgi:hypothetical protein